jgi:hypothetical protein
MNIKTIIKFSRKDIKDLVIMLPPLRTYDHLDLKCDNCVSEDGFDIGVSGNFVVKKQVTFYQNGKVSQEITV